MKNSISLKEHFLSVQGEGRYRGENCIFIRLGGCNRACEDLEVAYKTPKSDEIKYGCDSYHAVDMDFKDQWEEVNNLSQLTDILEKYNTCKNIVLTGGEPLIYAKNDIFKEFVLYCKNSDYKLTIETNGDISLKDISIYQSIVFSISPKDKIDFKPYWLLNKDSYIKALYKHPQLSLKYLEELNKKGMDIFLMPLGESSKKVEDIKKEVYFYCIDKGFNYTDREHLYMFGNNPDGENKILSSMSNSEHDTFRERKMALLDRW